jgi:hypothetical protein
VRAFGAISSFGPPAWANLADGKTARVALVGPSEHVRQWYATADVDNQGRVLKFDKTRLATGNKATAARAAVALSAKRPSDATLRRWMFDGVVKAQDGCRVEPDGHCEHGSPRRSSAL